MNILLAVKRQELAVAQAEQIAQIARETEHLDDAPSFKLRHSITAGGDPIALRGVPLVGVRGASAAIRFTQPGSEAVGMYAERAATVLL